MAEEKRMVQGRVPSSLPPTTAVRMLEAFGYEQSAAKIFREMGETGLIASEVERVVSAVGKLTLCTPMRVAKSRLICDLGQYPLHCGADSLMS